MGTQTNWAVLTQEVEDRRKGVRLPVAFRIEVLGFDRTGRLFSERTQTSNISKDGCSFHTQTPLERGSIVAIRLVSDPNGGSGACKPLLFQIRWVEAEGTGSAAGAVKLQPENIWDVAFPSGDIPPESA